MISEPTIGQDPWGVDLNAALTQIGDLATNVQDAAYGATGDGVTNDTAAVQAAITAVSGAGGGIVYFPLGTYLVSALTVPEKVRLVGAGPTVSTIKKSANGVLVSMSGPSTDTTSATHVKYGGIENLGLNGNSLTGNLLQLSYADNMRFSRVHFTSCNDVMVDTAEFWDSQFLNCTFETVVGGANTTTPMMYLRNSAAASGFGFSADNVNNIALIGCRFEDFTNGALRIDQGVNNSNNPNVIFVTDCKMETSAIRGGLHLNVADECRGVYVNGLYCYSGGFFSGFATAQNVIGWAPQEGSLENVHISNGATATINSGVDLFSGANSIAALRNVTGRYTTAPTGAHIFYEASSTADFWVESCYGTSGAQSAGTVPIRREGQPPFKQVAGVPSDGDFSHTPENGTLALNTTAGELYMRIGGAWVTVDSTPGSFTAAGNLIVSAIGSGLRVAEGSNAKMGVTTLVAGTKVVTTTAVTANSRIFITVQSLGTVAVASGYAVTARTAGTSFTITASVGTDTSVVAWMLVEPS